MEKPQASKLDKTEIKMNCCIIPNHPGRQRPGRTLPLRRQLKTTLTELNCVHDVEVSLAAEKAEFTCADVNVDQKTFVQTIEALGFKAELSKN